MWGKAKIGGLDSNMARDKSPFTDDFPTQISMASSGNPQPATFDDTGGCTFEIGVAFSLT